MDRSSTNWHGPMPGIVTAFGLFEAVPARRKSA